MIEKNSHFSSEILEKIKIDLLDRKEKLEKQLLAFAKHDPNQPDNFNSKFPKFGDKEDDNAAEVADFERNLSMEETFEQSLTMINRALRKLENGSYGLCEKCGRLINEERLKVMPTATKCAPGQGCVTNNED